MYPRLESIVLNAPTIAESPSFGEEYCRGIAAAIEALYFGSLKTVQDFTYRTVQFSGSISAFLTEGRQFSMELTKYLIDVQGGGAVEL